MNISIFVRRASPNYEEGLRCIFPLEPDMEITNQFFFQFLGESEK